MTHYKADGTNDLIDTKDLQMKSLREFMEVLGYNYYPLYKSFLAKAFEGFKSCLILSVNTAVKLHNSNWIESYQQAGYFMPTLGNKKTYSSSLGIKLRLDASSPFLVDAYTLNKAQSAKIITQLYLNGGVNGVSCYRDLVKFVDPVYEELFLSTLIREESSKSVKKNPESPITFSWDDY
jgi:hypothetical protein